MTPAELAPFLNTNHVSPIPPETIKAVAVSLGMDKLDYQKFANVLGELAMKFNFEKNSLHKNVYIDEHLAKGDGKPREELMTFGVQPEGSTVPWNPVQEPFPKIVAPVILEKIVPAPKIIPDISKTPIFGEVK